MKIVIIRYCILHIIHKNFDNTIKSIISILHIIQFKFNEIYENRKIVLI